MSWRLARKLAEPLEAVGAATRELAAGRFGIGAPLSHHNQVARQGPTLVIYDVRGAVVKVLADRWMSVGPHSVRWNGEDGRGRPAASGIYFCVLDHGGLTQSRKLVLLR